MFAHPYVIHQIPSEARVKVSFSTVQGGGAVKLEKVGGPEAALFDFARSGPHFGADGLIIGLQHA